jgi:hypothetical protein
MLGAGLDLERMSGPPATSSARRALPSELHLLFVGPEEPAWTVLTLQLDQAGCTAPRFRWCTDLAAAARIAAQERFDCLVIDDVTPAAEAASEVDSTLLDHIAALRTGGCLDPVLVLSDRVDDDWLSAAAEADCELLVTCGGWRSGAIVAWVRKTIERQLAQREREECGGGRERRVRESTESWRQWEARRDLAARLQSADCLTRSRVHDEAEHAAYSDLLRTAVLIGIDRLPAEMNAFVERLAARHCSAGDALAMHVAAVDSMLRGLGNRSAPHVLQRTDLVALELLARLADASSVR